MYMPVVSYRNSTSNHNKTEHVCFVKALYLIEILHQTTTVQIHLHAQYQLYLIEILHQTTTSWWNVSCRRRCILSKFYIKPQRKSVRTHLEMGCILSKFYIKPQPSVANVLSMKSCILSKFYIKPQQKVTNYKPNNVVSYRNSTSNHNKNPITGNISGVVSYRNSTSNHNGRLQRPPLSRLYLIEILHQTTTICNCTTSGDGLYLIEILHQTTTTSVGSLHFDSCILSKFYIKPQRRASY